MRVARPRYDKESCYYHVFNRVAGEPGWFPFGKVEREEMLRIMGHLNKLYTIEIISFVCMSNHFHAVVNTPVELPDVEEVDRRFKAYYGTKRQAPDWRIKENYEKYAHRMRDVSALMKDFQQQYTNWYNKTRSNGRRGTLWADRFKSVILERGRAVWECVQYVEMNPVRAKIVADAANYRHSTWGMLCGTGRHVFGVELAEHLPVGMRDLVSAGKEDIINLSLDERPLTNEEIIGCLRMNLARITAREAELGEAGVAEAVDEAKRKPGFALTVSRRVRHWSDGAIIGSKLFVKNMTAEFYGDKRAKKKRFDEAAEGLVSFRRLRNLS